MIYPSLFYLVQWAKHLLILAMKKAVVSAWHFALVSIHHYLQFHLLEHSGLGEICSLRHLRRPSCRWDLLLLELLALIFCCYRGLPYLHQQSFQFWSIRPYRRLPQKFALLDTFLAWAPPRPSSGPVQQQEVEDDFQFFRWLLISLIFSAIYFKVVFPGQYLPLA